MSFQKSVLSNNDLCVTDGKGSFALLRTGESARLMGFSLADNCDREACCGGLLSAAETAAFFEGAKTLIMDCFDKDTGVVDALKQAGYELTPGDSLISVKTDELLSSTGVQKSMRMKFPKVEALLFSELLTFQKEELQLFLEKLHFPMNMDRLSEYEDSISAVAYDENYEPKAVLLASLSEGEILVELLLGVSAKMPQYILAACQKFGESVQSLELAEEYPRMTMLTINESVVPLLRRLLNKEYKVVRKATVLHAKKELSDAKEEIAVWGDVDEDRIKLSAYQKNCNEKHIWIKERKKG